MENTINQCDGCMAQLTLVAGVHLNSSGRVEMLCQRQRYQKGPEVKPSDLFKTLMERRTMENETIGRIAYEAYANNTGFKSLVTGDDLPQWNFLAPNIQESWEVASKAVIAEFILRPHEFS